MAEYTIAPMATDADMDAKGSVHWKSWQEPYAGLVDADYLESVTLEKCRAMARRWPENTLIARDGEEAVGFICYGASRNADLRDCGEIFALYVLKRHHKRRAGYALMNAALEALAAHGRIVVWVLRGDDTAIDFYKRYGFRPDGAEKEILLGTPRVEVRLMFDRAKGMEA